MYLNPQMLFSAYISQLMNCTKQLARILTPAYRVDRHVSKDIEINGIQIPEGSCVAIPIVGIHYDPEIYSEPDQFRPER